MQSDADSHMAFAVIIPFARRGVALELLGASPPILRNDTRAKKKPSIAPAKIMTGFIVSKQARRSWARYDHDTHKVGSCIIC